MTHPGPLFDHAIAALTGLAIGDALGMPSQTLGRDAIKTSYGEITGFVAPVSDHPVSHGLRAGQVTDDTEQAFLLARRLIAGQGHIDEVALAQDFLDWEADVKARGLRDLLGPSTKAALDALLAGESVTRSGRNGTTNGAAMRIVPVGIATPMADLPGFVDQVELACRMTHNTGEAIAAAAAVAAVISRGIEGMAFDEAVTEALSAAEIGQGRGHPVGERDMADRIRVALNDARSTSSIDAFAARIGTSAASHESVAAAFGLIVLAEGNPWQCGLLAANIGDDTDTIGAISCAMAGACGGLSLIPPSAVETLRAANTLSFEETAADLLDLRSVATFASARLAVGS